MSRRVRAKNWNALRAVGESANRRLCDAEAQDAMPAPDMVAGTPGSVRFAARNNTLRGRRAVEGSNQPI